mmetsp:Transcript_4092/g.11510  ORF Transcript_4092/g.11510 Transcript_4092/m.11510 type:complete len:127 (+) Transcript_4092:336-716(+)
MASETVSSTTSNCVIGADPGKCHASNEDDEAARDIWEDEALSSSECCMCTHSFPTTLVKFHRCSAVKEDLAEVAVVDTEEFLRAQVCAEPDAEVCAEPDDEVCAEPDAEVCAEPDAVALSPARPAK